MPEDPMKAFMPNLDEYVEKPILTSYKAYRAGRLDSIRDRIFNQLKESVDNKTRSYEPISVFIRESKNPEYRYNTDKSYGCEIYLQTNYQVAYVIFGVAFSNTIVINSDQEIQSENPYSQSLVGDIYGLGDIKTFKCPFSGNIIDALHQFAYHIVESGFNYFDSYVSALVIANEDGIRAREIVSEAGILPQFQQEAKVQKEMLWNRAYAKYSLDYAANIEHIKSFFREANSYVGFP